MTLTRYVDKNYEALKAVFPDWFKPVEYPKFLGIENTQYIWHGEWSDPEILYKGVSIGSWDIDDGMYNMYTEDIDEGLYPDGYDYDNWVSENKDRIADMLDDMYWNLTTIEEE